MFIIRLYGPDGMLLLTVQIQRNLTQAKMLEIERITVGVNFIPRRGMQVFRHSAALFGTTRLIGYFAVTRSSVLA